MPKPETVPKKPNTERFKKNAEKREKWNGGRERDARHRRRKFGPLPMQL